MIRVTLYKNANRMITGIDVSGHAGYADYGKDIVCAAVSVLVLNTINSIEQFTSDKFHLKQDEKTGHIEFKMILPISNDASLLLNSLALGLKGITEQYSDKYIKFAEVEDK